MKTYMYVHLSKIFAVTLDLSETNSVILRKVVFSVLVFCYYFIYYFNFVIIYH